MKTNLKTVEHLHVWRATVILTENQLKFISDFTCNSNCHFMQSIFDFFVSFSPNNIIYLYVFFFRWKHEKVLLTHFMVTVLYLSLSKPKSPLNYRFFIISFSVKSKNLKILKKM